MNRKFSIVEMETSGLYQALDPGDNIEILSIRGISDYADNKKNELEENSNNIYRDAAANNAARFLELQLLHNPFFVKAISEIGISNEVQRTEIIDPIADVIQLIEAANEAALVELAPDYKAQSKGYRIPVPRVTASTPLSKQIYLEPIQLIEVSKKIIIEVPSTYPDKALPWLYSKELLGQSNKNKIVITCVISGLEIKPPKGSISNALSEFKIDILRKDPNIEICIIINQFPFESKSKTDYIKSEIESNADLSFIIMAQGAYDGFKAQKEYFSSWVKYNIANVSFRSIVNFLSANFSFDPKEAEVIALRLSDTFKSFNVPVHPSYFAGLPKELLNRFTEANHRAELINLAVTGFLSFFGAGDTKDLMLKQRTRRLFLQEIARRIVIEKQTFTIGSLVVFTTDYSNEYDFGIDSLEFVSSFIKNGILHEENKKIVFTIPFIQNYLLSEWLVSNPEIACKYFDPTFGDIDFNTFELYCEIGVCEKIVTNVYERIEKHIEKFGEEVNNTGDYVKFLNGSGTGSYRRSGHAFTSGVLKPSLLNEYGKLVSQQKRIEKLALDLLASNDDVEGKQDLIDVADQASEEAKAQRVAEAAESGKGSAEAEIGRDWTMAVILLGSAAEELNAQVKRKFIAKIVRLANLMLDDWLTAVGNSDFASIKRKIRASANDRAAIEGDTEFDEELYGKYIDLVVDSVEMNELTNPFFQLCHLMSEYARNKVLHRSFTEFSPLDISEDIIGTMWRMELNPEEVEKGLEKIYREIGNDVFARTTIATYLISRAFWYRGTAASRKVFVEAANEAVKVFALKYDPDMIKATSNEN